MSTLPENFVSDLMIWYDAHAASLPWRGSTDPYRVWLSEIMLQQTQIETVTPYYARFIAQFPTIADLAAAPIDSVLKAWEGLGYYSRARHLHRTSQVVVSTLNGQFPTAAAELEKLPGIGRYTAGAIASMVYGEHVAALDGNAIRVLTRLYDIDQDVTRPATVRDLWTLDESLVPADRPGDYNQAMMDLGRIVCVTRQPKCGECPVMEHCLAYEHHTQTQRPVKAKRTPTPHVDVAAGLIRQPNGSILIAQRHSEKLLGGLWGLPGGNMLAGESAPVALHRILNADDATLQLGGVIGAVAHAFTHFRMTLHIVTGDWLLEDPILTLPEYQSVRWAPIDVLDTFAFARADRRALDLARKSGWLNNDVSPHVASSQLSLWEDNPHKARE